MDLFEENAPGGNAPEFSVAELSGAVKRVIEGEFGRIRVKGEVGRVMHARSGHLYFDLKDDRAVLACTTWKGQIPGLTVIPEEGMEVVATGKMTTFGSQSKYQLNAEDVTVAGVGALMAMLEKRKAQLAAEGLFAADRKKALPYLPDIIGVVTSPTGAVIRDILHRLRDRFPRKVLVWPVLVQGKGSAEQVARAIRGFDSLTPGGALPRPDVLIVARGGGSIEDLWGFNEEIVARAAAECSIPLISAVGHETDTTLIDYVADHRAPTPTAAAELAVPVRLELLAGVDGLGHRLATRMAGLIEQRGQRLRDLTRALPRPEQLMSEARQRFDLASDALSRALIDRVRLGERRLLQAVAAIRPQALSARLDTEKQRLAALSQRAAPALQRQAREARILLDRTAPRLRPKTVAEAIGQRRIALENASRRLSSAARAAQDKRRAELSKLDRLRETLSYRSTLSRGYAVVRSDGALVTRADQAKSAKSLEIEFSDGRVSLGGAKGGKAKPEDGEQGSLF